MTQVTRHYVSINERPLIKKLYDRMTDRSHLHLRNDWRSGTLFAGIFAAYEVTGDGYFLREVNAWAERHDFKLHHRHGADRHCAGQTYLDLQRLTGHPVEVGNIVAELETFESRSETWHWADALFMSPPLYGRVFRITGDIRYLEVLDRHFAATVKLLYDPAEQLFYRDPRAVKAANNGIRVFWGRGNGWVIAGLARTLPSIPDTHLTRPQYVNLFHDLAARLVTLQGSDGLWRTDLTNVQGLDAETSATGLIVFALSWGINTGVLDRARYEESVRRGWMALVDQVDDRGFLGRVQKPAKAPGSVAEADTANYGAGAFLLAASEIMKMSDQKK